MRVIAAEEEVLTRLVVVGSSTSPNAQEQEATLGTQTVESVRFKPSAVYALYLLLRRVIALPSPSTPTLASPRSCTRWSPKCTSLSWYLFSSPINFLSCTCPCIVNLLTCIIRL